MTDYNLLKKYIDKVTWHWSATNYFWKPPHKNYHFVIDGDGRVVQYLSLMTVGAHTWRRNTGNIGIAFAAMWDDPKTSWFDCPIKDVQIEAMACLTAELMIKLNIPFENVHDHAFFAKLDKYWPYRWDIGDKEWVVRNKTKWYYQKLKSGERKFKYTNVVF